MFILPAAPAMKPIEVLFIEDSAGDALLMRRVLSDSPVPVNLRLARDGQQALAILENKSYQPGLIILDLHIPGMSGHALLGALQPKNVPVVVFSSSWDEAEVQRSLALGAREFVRKPIDLEAYKGAVWRMVEKWGVRREEDV
jgi:CheY-like chemotaxis protein